MANYNGDVGSYSHSDYTGLREAFFNRVHFTTSATEYAQFASRNKVLVRAVHVWIRSAMSAAGGSLYVARGTTTIAAVTVVSGTTTGTYHCITCTSLNTLATITDVMGVGCSGAVGGKGDLDIMYEYQVLYPSTLIGA